MRTVNIHEAKTYLSRLIEQASNGEPFIIAKAGKPMVKVSAVDVQDTPQPKRLAFLAGQIDLPDDFNEMGKEEIEALFSIAK